MLVPKLTLVHGAAVWEDDLAIDSQRRVSLDLGDAENRDRTSKSSGTGQRTSRSECGDR
jgi:hypothetical protein